jgi:hypothetical protein
MFPCSRLAGRPMLAGKPINYYWQGLPTDAAAMEIARRDRGGAGFNPDEKPVSDFPGDALFD